MGHDTKKKLEVLYIPFVCVCDLHDNLASCKASGAQRVYITYSR